MRKVEIALTEYIQWVREGGLTVYEPKRAGTYFLQRAIELYGRNDVLRMLQPHIPEIVENTHRTGLRIWVGNSKPDKERRQRNEDFYDAYQNGEEVSIDGFTITKPK
jgi:hypothetical protein